LTDLLKEILGAAHGTDILLFLHRNREPRPTNEIMNAVGVSNWATAASSLRRLERAGLVVMKSGTVGRYKSRARLWMLEPNYGAKVATMLEDLARLGSVHAAMAADPSPGEGLEHLKGPERPAIADVELAREKIVSAVQTVVGKVAATL
jgi:DNA-binding HxlR family transcriptional regulator